MTRKRFVKLMMAKGYSRNLANDIAETVRTGEQPSYQQLFETFDLTLIQDIEDVLTNALRTMAGAFSAACDAMAAVLSRWGAQFRSMAEQQQSRRRLVSCGGAVY